MGEIWDITFNPSKSQIVTFGGQNPCQYHIVLNGNPVPWVNRVKYLGVHFSCYTELTDFYRKFHSQFNSILSVLGKCSNDCSSLDQNLLLIYIDVWVRGLVVD